jgi:hypothetical protein
MPYTTKIKVNGIFISLGHIFDNIIMLHFYNVFTSPHTPTHPHTGH